MKNLDKLSAMAKERLKEISKEEIRDVFRRMSHEQLLELAEGNPDESRVKEILVSVDGLKLLNDRR